MINMISLYSSSHFSCFPFLLPVQLDVLPVIPIFNIASAVGVPFVDKTVRVETLADAIVQGIADEEVEGVQRYMQMEALAKA